MQKKTRIIVLGLAAVMAATLVGCAQITQSNATDAAAVVGLGSAKSYSSGSSGSILARTVIENKDAIVAAQEKGLGITASFSTSYGGGTVTFSYLGLTEPTSFPDSTQITGFSTSSYWSIAYNNVTVNYDGETYTLNGTIYMRFDLNIASFNFILTGNVEMSGAIEDTARIDVVFNASTSGYTFTGTVNDYKVDSTFTIS